MQGNTSSSLELLQSNIEYENLIKDHSVNIKGWMTLVSQHLNMPVKCLGKSGCPPSKGWPNLGISHLKFERFNMILEVHNMHYLNTFLTYYNIQAYLLLFLAQVQSQNGCIVVNFDPIWELSIHDFDQI